MNKWFTCFFCLSIIISCSTEQDNEVPALVGPGDGLYILCENNVSFYAPLNNNSNDSIFFDELKDSALIRELHVYGLMVPHNSNKKATQHFGFGKRLLKAAEHIAMDNNFNKISVISGIGVTEYYKKRGYKLQDHFMVKNIVSRIEMIIFGFGLLILD